VLITSLADQSGTSLLIPADDDMNGAGCTAAATEAGAGHRLWHSSTSLQNGIRTASTSIGGRQLTERPFVAAAVTLTLEGADASAALADALAKLLAAFDDPVINAATTNVTALAWAAATGATRGQLDILLVLSPSPSPSPASPAGGTVTPLPSPSSSPGAEADASASPHLSGTSSATFPAANPAPLSQRHIQRHFPSGTSSATFPAAHPAPLSQRHIQRHFVAKRRSQRQPRGQQHTNQHTQRHTLTGTCHVLLLSQGVQRTDQRASCLRCAHYAREGAF
jgi:hypothetical protein